MLATDFHIGFFSPPFTYLVLSLVHMNSSETKIINDFFLTPQVLSSLVSIKFWSKVTLMTFPQAQHPTSSNQFSYKLIKESDSWLKINTNFLKR